MAGARRMFALSIAGAAIGLAAWLAPATGGTFEEGGIDWGGGIHGQLTPGAMADLAGNGIGVDAALRWRRASSRLGLRLDGAVTKHATTKTRNSDINVGTSHVIDRLSVGPQWSVPTGDGRWELYALGGVAWARPGMDGIGVTHDEPSASHAPVASVGAALLQPVEFRDGSYWVEVGLELHAGGKALFFGHPPLVPDGSGGYRSRSERAPISGITLRIGFSKTLLP